LVLQQYFTSVMKLHPSQGVLRIGLHLNPHPAPKPPPPPQRDLLTHASRINSTTWCI